MLQGEAQTEEEALALLFKSGHGNVDWALLSCKKKISSSKTDRKKVPPPREIRDIHDDSSSEEEQGGSVVGIYIDGLPEVAVLTAPSAALTASSATLSVYLSLATSLVCV